MDSEISYYLRSQNYIAPTNKTRLLHIQNGMLPFRVKSADLLPDKMYYLETVISYCDSGANNRKTFFFYLEKGDEACF